MITEDYVSFETAKLLKEKGYWNMATMLYKENGDIVNYNVPLNNKGFSSTLGVFYEAPTLQMAMKWIREKGFHIYSPMEIDYDEDERGDKWYHDAAYYPEIRRVSDGKIMYDDGALYVTPEQACEAAIKYCLEYLI